MLKKNFYLAIVILLFIILCVSFILMIPAFEAPDEPWHFSYAFYLSKYNKMPSQYNEPIPIKQYIKENIEENSLNVFYMDDKYMFYTERSGELWYLNKFHHPPLYYFISSQIIKPYDVNNIYIEDNYYQERGIYIKYLDNKILKNNSPTISLVLILRLFQIVYGMLIIFFIYKIIKLLSDDEFKNNSVLLISGIAFLPQFIFLCSYINNDIITALFGVVSLYFSMLLFKRDKAYLGLVSVLFAFIGGFTKYTAFIMVPVTIITFLIWLIIKKKKWALISVSAVVFLVIAVFYYVISILGKNPPVFLNRIISLGNGILADLREGKFSFYIGIPELKQTLRSTVAVFGWLNVVADKFIYNFFIAYIISGILLFFINIKEYRENKKSIIFIIASIISVFVFFLLYSFYTHWIQHQGRVILLAVFLTFILAILGFKSIKASYKNILYYGLFTSSLFISVFCLYNYIYLKYY